MIRKREINQTLRDEGFYVVRSKRPMSTAALVSILSLIVRFYN